MNRRFNNIIILLLMLGVLVLPIPQGHAQQASVKAPSATASNAARRAAEQITAEQLKDYLYFIASDEMEGRDTPSRGLDLTAKFIAMNLSRWGLKPAGDDGTYFQRIALRRTKIAPSESTVEVNGQTFDYGEGFLTTPVAANLSGALIYAGHGWVVTKKGINPYEGLDVRDKIIVVQAGIPDGINSFADLGGKKGVDWFLPTDYAKKNGAKAIITIPAPEALAYWDLIRHNQEEKGSIIVERFEDKNDITLPNVTASRAMVEALFQGERVWGQDVSASKPDGSVKSFELAANKRATLNIKTTNETVYTQNVVAVLEGSDPVLKNEYVAIGAHYDHVGTGVPSNAEGRFASTKDKTDFIYNGADDDGSGTVAVLAMAQTFAAVKPSPKRSLIFIWHCGEEKGLWGSRYFTENPSGAINLNQVVAQLNIDMIGRSRHNGDTNPANKELAAQNEIYVIGSKMMSTELGDLSERVNRGYLNLSLNYKYDDPNDPNQFFFRSDHYNYAKRGVPVIFYTDGEHEDYHRPSDSPDRIDYDQMLKVTRTIYMTAAEIAGIPARPRVDKKLPGELSGD